MNLLKFAQNSNVETAALDSSSCPLFRDGMRIDVAPEHDQPSPPSKEARKKLPSALDVLSGDAEPLSVRYLTHDATSTCSQDLDVQVRKELYILVESSELGYFSHDQKTTLQKNLYIISNVLCFVDKHWKTLLKADYPAIPDGDYSFSQLLRALLKCGRENRKNVYDERLTLKKVAQN